MSMEFYLTRTGRTHYERTLPELVRQLERLNENLEKLIEHVGTLAEAQKDSGKEASS